MPQGTSGLTLDGKVPAPVVVASFAPAIPVPSPPLVFDLALPDTHSMPLTVTQLTDRLMASYAHAGGINNLDGKNLPSKSAIALLTCDLLRLLFPGFFDEKLVHSSEIKAETASLFGVVTVR